MAIHDLWSFDNAPVGTSLLGGTTNVTSVSNNTNLYSYYTGNPGMIYTAYSGVDVSVSADGFLTMTRSSSGLSNVLYALFSQVMNWTSSTKFMMGFRTKSSVAVTAASTGKVLCSITSGFAGALGQIFVNESDLVAAANTELYVELFFDSVALTYSLYINGLLIRTTALSTANFNSALYWQWDTGSTAAVTASTRGYRDFYFLDVDSTDTIRLGPIRSSKATLSNISGSEWVLNSATDLPTALNTALQNPPITTPSASSPADNQALSMNLGTAVAAGINILALQPQMTLITDGLNNTLDLAIKQSINTIDAGPQTLPAATTTYNQRMAIQRVAPDGGTWSVSKVNATSVVLTPGLVPSTAALLHFDGANAATTTTDAKGHAVAITGAGALSTAQSKFGGSSYAPNSTGNLKITDSGDLATPGDFTVEFFSYLTAMPSTGFFAHRNTSGGTTTAILILSGNLMVAMDDSSTGISVTAASWIVTGQWQHIAVSKQGTSLRLFVNGTLVTTVTTTKSWGNVSIPFTIGSNGLGGNAIPGYIDEFRLSKVARYTASFTPPTAPFTLD